MQVNAYKNDLKGNILAAKLMDETAAITKELGFLLPRGWRQIVRISPDDVAADPLFYLDLQSDKGGGSWAEAKIKTLGMLDQPVTTPLDSQTVLKVVHEAGLDEAPIARQIMEKVNNGVCSSEQFSPEELKWLVDVNEGPGLAPNFGGIRLKYRCNFFLGNGTPAADTEIIDVAFSGAKSSWQDLQFMTMGLKQVVKHLNGIEDESIEFDFEPFENYPDAKMWLINYGLMSARR